MNADQIAEKLRPLVTYSIIPTPEYDTPEGKFATGDDEKDAGICQKIREDAEWNVWAWCVVEVRAEYEGIHGSDYLGSCSYAGEADFRESGYLASMQDEALHQLAAKLTRLQIME